MARLCFGFYSSSGISHTPWLLDINNNITGLATVVASFSRKTFFAFTLDIPVNYQGFVLFEGANGVQPILYPINPQESLNADIQISTLQTGTGSGSTQFPVVVTTSNSLPVEGAQVWISSDNVGVFVIAGKLITDPNGLVTFLLNPGTYYLWRSHPDYTFTNPQLISV